MNKIIFISASWCGPCKMMKPTIEQIKSKIDVEEIDVDTNRDEAISYGVRSVPTLIFIKDGKEHSRKVGVISISEILNIMI